MVKERAEGEREDEESLARLRLYLQQTDIPQDVSDSHTSSFLDFW